MINDGRLVPVDPVNPSVRRFGADANAVRLTKIYLDAARTNVPFVLKGNWLWIQDASSLTAAADSQFNFDQGDKFTLRKGWFLRGVFFEQLILTHSAQAGEWLSVMYGVEELGNLSVVNPTASASSFTETKATTIIRSHTTVDYNGGVAVSILAALATRRAVTIQSYHGNTELVGLGHGTIDAIANGYTLAPGESVRLTTSDDIFANATTDGLFQRIVMLEERD